MTIQIFFRYSIRNVVHSRFVTSSVCAVVGNDCHDNNRYGYGITHA